MSDQDEPDVSGDDEFEMRVEEMRESARDAHRASAAQSDLNPGSPQPDRFRAMRLTFAIIALVAIAAFALAPGGGLSRINSSVQIALSGFSSAYPTPTLVQGPPTIPGPPPRSCTPPAPETRIVSVSHGGSIGASPIWVGGFDGPQATKYNLQALGHDRYGWKTLVDFLVEPGVTGHVTVRGESLPDGSPIWIGVDDPEHNIRAAKPSVAITLDPKTPGLPDYWNTSFGVSDDWAAWRGVLYIPAAGCYALDATWPGGSWRITFAAGL